MQHILPPADLALQSLARGSGMLRGLTWAFPFVSALVFRKFLQTAVPHRLAPWLWIHDLRNSNGNAVEADVQA